MTSKQSADQFQVQILNVLIEDMRIEKKTRIKYRDQRDRIINRYRKKIPEEEIENALYQQAQCTVNNKYRRENKTLDREYLHKISLEFEKLKCFRKGYINKGVLLGVQVDYELTKDEDEVLRDTDNFVLSLNTQYVKISDIKNYIIDNHTKEHNFDTNNNKL